MDDANTFCPFLPQYGVTIDGNCLMIRVKNNCMEYDLDQALAKEYGAKGLTACPMTPGQIAIDTQPDGLCDETWKAIDQHVSLSREE